MAASPARAIVAECLRLRLTHPDAPPLDTLDLVMRGRQVRADDFGSDATPPASFALVIAGAFDRGMPPEDWRGLLGPNAAPALRSSLLSVWTTEVWPKFVARYGLT